MLKVILASASPRRAQLLQQIRIDYEVFTSDIDETALQDEAPADLVMRLAMQKSQAITSELPVLGADTLGLIGDQLLIKPDNFAHARSMLRAISGNWHEILSAVAVTYRNNTEVLLNRNRVLFRHLTDAEIKDYWQTGEPQDKAGAYAIQGLAAAFIERIEGSYSGIMGLPLFETSQLLANIKERINKNCTKP